MENASDVLAGWLANAEPQFVKEPSSKGLKRSIVLRKATEEYLQKQSVEV
jgi:hypothetical protein